MTRSPTLNRATDRRDLTGDVAAENRGIVEPWQKRDVLQNPVEWVDRDGRVADQYLVRRQMRQSGDTDPQWLPRRFLPGGLISHGFGHHQLFLSSIQLGVRLSGPTARSGARSGSYSPQDSAPGILGALAPPPKRVLLG